MAACLVVLVEALLEDEECVADAEEAEGRGQAEDEEVAVEPTTQLDPHYVAKAEDPRENRHPGHRGSNYQSWFLGKSLSAVSREFQCVQVIRNKNDIYIV